MKTKVDLLVRDCLAAVFVRAAAGEVEAAALLDRLADWARRPAGDDPRDAAPSGPVGDLGDLRTEHGEPLYDASGQLHPAFAALEPYIRDRAQRFVAALGWLEEAEGVASELERARAAWDAGLFFEVHELLEPPWLEAEGSHKTALQGLILAGAALHHLTRDNLAGAGSLLLDAERRLQESPRLDSVELGEFGRHLGDLGRRIRSGQLSHWSQLEELPRF